MSSVFQRILVLKFKYALCGIKFGGQLS